MKLDIYQYSKCGTCRMATKWLEAHGAELNRIEIFEQPPTKEQLAEIVKLSGLEVKKLFNTSGEVYKEMNLKDKLPSLSDDEKLELLASNGRLIKRPLVTDGKQATVGFKAEHYDLIWGK